MDGASAYRCRHFIDAPFPDRWNRGRGRVPLPETRARAQRHPENTPRPPRTQMLRSLTRLPRLHHRRHAVYLSQVSSRQYAVVNLLTRVPLGPGIFFSSFEMAAFCAARNIRERTYAHAWNSKRQCAHLAGMVFPASATLGKEPVGQQWHFRQPSDRSATQCHSGSPTASARLRISGVSVRLLATTRPRMSWAYRWLGSH